MPARGEDPACRGNVPGRNVVAQIHGQRLRAGLHKSAFELADIGVLPAEIGDQGHDGSWGHFASKKPKPASQRAGRVEKRKKSWSQSFRNLAINLSASRMASSISRTS